MSESKKQNPLDEFDIAGIKTVSSYDYFLLIDATGNCYIARVASDDSSYKFCKMPTPVASTYSEIATAIDNFWGASIQNYTYVYLFQA